MIVPLSHDDRYEVCRAVANCESCRQQQIAFYGCCMTPELRQCVLLLILLCATMRGASSFRQGSVLPNRQVAECGG